MGKDKTARFRGGKQNKRDRWFGLAEKPDFETFEDWWHAQGKFDYDGDYITRRAQAEEVYDDWVALGKPEVG